MHGPERLFDVDLAYNNDGRVRAMRMRAVDNVGAYAGRSPFPLGNAIGATTRCGHVAFALIVCPCYPASSPISSPTPKHAAHIRSLHDH
jgi:hypothetical protein